MNSKARLLERERSSLPFITPFLFSDVQSKWFSFVRSVRGRALDSARASEVRSIGSGLRLAREAAGRASCNWRRETYRFRVPAIKILHGLGSAEKKKPTSAGLVTGAACEQARVPIYLARRPRFLEKRERKKTIDRRQRRRRRRRRRYVSTSTVVRN